MNQDTQQSRPNGPARPETDQRREGGDHDPNQSVAYGATEDEMSRDASEIAPTFSDTEPGAGPNFGAAGDTDAPNWGGVEDQTTLGPESARSSE